MKNQYFGDIGDYKKFNLLKTLHKQGNLTTCVCWMLTSDDGTNDGRFTHYLHSPEEWKYFDPELYKLLHEAVIQKNNRSLTIIENSDILHGSFFYSDLISDNQIERKVYFDKLTSISNGFDILFFDPDNGIEVKSIVNGKKGSNKYIFWDEIVAFNKLGFNLLIYQHFPRVERNKYIRELSLQIMEKLSIDLVYAIKVRHAAFFLVPNLKSILSIETSLQFYSNTWKNHALVSKHSKESAKYFSDNSQPELF